MTVLVGENLIILDNFFYPYFIETRANEQKFNFYRCVRN